MDIYASACLLLTASVGLAYLNHRYIRMPASIAIMSGALLISIALLVLDTAGFHHIGLQAKSVLSHLDFHALLINGMLGFLLFAGGLHIDLHALVHQKWEITVLATLGTVASTLLVGFSTYALLNGLHVPMPLADALLFGALISPTDPIAVLAIFKRLGAPTKLSIKVEAESLFNDGVGIVLFLSIYQLIFSHEPITLFSVSYLFFKQALGGILYGLILGFLVQQLMRSIDDQDIEILITLAVATGGYTLAQAIHVSGPLAMVVSGLWISYCGHTRKKKSERLMIFWGLLDEGMNAFLFLMIGLELIVIQADDTELMIALMAIVLVLLSRYLVVAIPINIFKIWRQYTPHVISIMTWGGLRGGLAVALALSIPENPYRHITLVMTYAVVLFSIIVQGLSIKPWVQRCLRQ